MKHNSTTKEITSLPVSTQHSASLSAQEKVQQNNPCLFFLYPKTKNMKTIFTLMLALFIQTTVFSQVTSFTSAVKNNRVDLSWATASEKNVSHFIIEKSEDGKNYKDAGIVFAFGNTTTTMNYPFFEKNIKANQEGVIYYRLNEVTNDGIITFSQVTTVQVEKINEQVNNKNILSTNEVLVR